MWCLSKGGRGTVPEPVGGGTRDMRTSHTRKGGGPSYLGRSRRRRSGVRRVTVLDRLLGRERTSGDRVALSLPSAETAVYGVTAALLFGGLFLAAVGTVWGYIGSSDSRGRSPSGDSRRRATGCFSSAFSLGRATCLSGWGRIRHTVAVWWFKNRLEPTITPDL